MNFRALIATLCCTGLFACGGETITPKPVPVQVTRDDIGYFCGMIVEDHSGPKSQIFLKGQARPLWFTTARDGVAFQRLPEETRPILAFYVSAVDIGGWEHPESDTANMIEAEQAWFVIGSGKQGSMGAPEAIPFSLEQAAQDFAVQHGGRVLRLADIPEAYILGPDQGGADPHVGH
jgi:copper chaperone NosL